MPSVKKNFIYNGLLTTANIIFPMIVYPYVSRVLGVSKIGLCSFISSIIDYFILFSVLGISVLGIREIAASRTDKERLDKVFSTLFCLNAITTFLMLVILICVTVFVPRLIQNWELMLIGAFKLVFNFLLIEWFYKGIEDFKYITIRTLVVRVLYVVFVFVLIRDESDYIMYFLLTTLMIVINAVINVVHSRRFVSFSLKQVDLKQFLRPYCELGVYRVLTSLYLSFNVIYLGFVANDIEVGYYATATKLYAITLSFFTAFTGVMMPRMSSLFAGRDMTGFKSYVDKSYNFLFSMVIPLIVFTEINTESIIAIISGKGYDGAIVPMQIVMPLLLIVGVEQILIEQILMPMKKDRVVTINAVVGAVLGVSLNLLLVPRFNSIGSACVVVVSEFAIFMLAVFEVKKYLNINFPLGTCLKQIVLYIPLVIIEWLVVCFTPNYIVGFFINGIIFCIYFIIVQQYIVKTVDIRNIIKSIVRKRVV